MEAIRRKRSRTGCMTCRARKVRCDEQHPACGACQRLCLPCTFPSPADLARGNRKSAQPRQSRFCVRFVDGANITNSGRSPRYDRSTGLGPSPRSPPTSTSSCSPKGPGPGPGPGPGSGPGPGQGLLYSTPSPPSSTLWPTDSDHTSLAAASAVPSSMFFHPGTSTIIDMDLLHAASLESDVDLLWDTLPAFDDFVPGPEGPFPMANVPPVTQPVARPPPLDPAPSHSLSATPPAPKQMVLMRSEDREPLQHFLSTMVQFVKLRTSNSDNIYCYIFTSMALTHAPLYEAILAWAALHMAHVQSASTEDAEQRFQRASQLLYEDTEAASHVDLTVVTVWFLLQYELFLASGVDRFVALLDYVAGTVEPLFARHSAIAINERLGPVAVRVLVWLAAFDSRAAVLGNPCRLLRCLQQHLTDGQDRDFVSARDSSLVLDQYSVSSSSMAAATEMQACLSLSLRLNVARGSCTILGRWHGDVAKRDAGWQSLCGSLAAIRRQMKQQDSVPAAQLALRVASGAMDAPSTLSALEYNWLQLTATYYGMVAAYHRNRPASLPEDPVEAGLPSSADCAARIIRISRQATLSRPNTPQAIWPPVLFTAAVETTDPIYQAWAIGAFISAEAWAPHLRRTRQLLERMIELRREVKGPYSIATAMEATGGVFVL